MTGTKCCVPGCHNNTKYNRNVSWHVFPKNLWLRNQWLDKLIKLRHYPNWELKPYSKICGIHFNLSGKKTRYDQFPQYFLPGKAKSPKTPEIKWNDNVSIVNSVRLFLVEEQLKRKDMSLEDIDIGAEVDVAGNNSTEEELKLEGLSENDDKFDEGGDHTYCMKYKVSSKVIQMERTIQTMSRTIQAQQGAILNLNLRIRAEMSNACHERYAALKESNPHCKCMSKNRLTIKEILENAEALQFYTGFQNKDLFMRFADLMKPAYDESRQTKRRKTPNQGRPRILSYLEELFVVYSRLRRNLLEDDIASKFNVSRATVSNVWTYWIDLLYEQLSQTQTWSSQTRPNEILLDSTELSVESSSDSSVRNDIRSRYKSQNTVKGLVGITPDGLVTFVSNLYGGRKNERTIVSDCGVLDFMEENDQVVVDRGFIIRDLMEMRKVKFKTVSSGGRQLPEEEIVLRKEIAAHRVRVERVIRLIKNFQILKSTLPNTMRYKLNKIWKVCCFSLNFITEPLL